MDRDLVVSTDGHAGAPMPEYRRSLDSRYYDAFDKALPIQMEQTARAEESFLIADFNREWRKKTEYGLAGAWDSELRNRIIDEDGVVAEVLFPDGITEMNSPPFGAGLGLKPWGIDPALEGAGARSEERWMAEGSEERRVG